jgi:hypothetical protein
VPPRTFIDTRRGLAAAAFAAALLLAPTPARAADEASRRLAQVLFDEARALMDAGEYGQACPKLAESQRLDPGGGTLLNLALCREAEGKTATAWTLFHDSLERARADGRADREQIARERIEALAPKLSRLRVRVAPRSAPGPLTVSIDELILGEGARGTAIPVDPGRHTVSATAPGHEPFRREVEVPADGAVVDVEVPALAPAQGEPGATGTLGGRTTRPNPVFYAAVAGTALAAAVSLVTGTVWSYQRLSLGTSLGSCDSERGFCRDEAALSAIRTQYDLALASTIAGGLALGGAVALILIPRRVARATGGAALAPLISPHGAGVRAQVAF